MVNRSESATFSRIVKCASRASCSIYVDIDETIFNPLERWRTHIMKRLGISFEIQDVELAGSLDNYFARYPDYADFVALVEEMRADNNLYTGLPVIPGAQEAFGQLNRDIRLKVCGYLTARPHSVLNTTKQELKKNGFPIQPILTRPPDIHFMSSTSWKLGVLEQICQVAKGPVIMIDDKPELAEAILDRNLLREAGHPLVSILFNGPLTYTYVKNHNLTSEPNNHFYVAEWNQVPGICSQYAAALYPS